MDLLDERARELDETARVEGREPTVIELMNGPRRPGVRSRRAVLWVGFSFASFMLAVTVAVIVMSGLDLLSLLTLAMLLMIVFAMIGALRYQGEDPLADFEPHDDLRPRLRRRRADD